MHKLHQGNDGFLKYQRLLSLHRQNALLGSYYQPETVKLSLQTFFSCISFFYLVITDVYLILNMKTTTIR